MQTPSTAAPALPPFAGTAAEPVKNALVCKVAFVCTGNTGRSVIAAALARALVRDRGLPIGVISRGLDLDPGNTGPEPEAAALLLQRGIDVAAHGAAPLTADDVRRSDLVITMTGHHRATILERHPDAEGKVFTIAGYATGAAKDVVDAWRQPRTVYEQVFAEISQYLPVVLEKAAAGARQFQGNEA